ncbi:corticoliberin-like [Eublepharis macularius]|uniref:Corticoliberin-like n=1 Tax=Eublepharis macularius TaxID=481883 RepID=A0AA97L0L3_EUBMA|nr:corticoliberin-like [Eublepharis macularius]
MMARMVPTASFLVLLFLPPKSCLPLEWPRPAPPRFTPVGASPRGQWPSLWEPEDEPSSPAADPRPLQSCKPPGPAHLSRQQQQQRAERSAPSSKRRDGRPNSLDLTFHLLREFLEMSREERLAQKARSNKILLHNIGK